MNYVKKDYRENPLAGSNFVSATLFFWVLPLFKMGRQKNLELDDLYDPCGDDLAEQTGNALEK